MRSSATRTTRRCRACAAWPPPASSGGSPARGSTTTAAEVVARLGLPPCPWRFPPASSANQHGLVAHGADLEPSTLVTAYASAIFPMPVNRRRLGWWSPDPRGILPLDRLAMPRSLRRSLRRYRTTVDTAFTAVIESCATVPRPHGWITAPLVDAYVELHRLGVAHSVECWDGEHLVGGLYGVAIGGLFAGESMFHLAPDASKVALVRLVELLSVDEPLLDVQWTTPHLVRMGAIDIPRRRYCELLEDALDRPNPFASAAAE